MELEGRMIVSSEETLQAVERALDKLKTLRYDSGYRMLLGEALTDRLEGWDRSIRARKEDPFTVVVIGDFKRGKSTFINALLGSEVVTTDVTTETVTFNRVSYGAASNEAVLSRGRRMRLSDDELKREELEKLLETAGEPVRRLELKRPCELLKNVTIIDTPGTGDAMQDFGKEVEEDLLQADAVVYLYSLRYPLSQSEQMFLKAAVLPQPYTKLFLVGNYADTAGNEADYRRVRREAEQRVHGLLPGAEIYTISALDELCRRLGEERPCEALAPILEEQFAALRSAIEDLAREKKESVIVERMQRLMGAMLGELEEDLARLEQGLAMSREEAKEELQSMEEQKAESAKRQERALREIDASISRMRGEANVWMTDFVRRLQAETGNLSAASSDDLMKYYSFYCVDLMQKAMNACVDYHREELFEELQGISTALAKEVAGSFTGSGYNFRFSFDNKIWTKGDNIGLAVSFVSSVVPLTMLASVVADGISGHLRQREIQGEQKAELLKRISEQMNTLEGAVAATIQQMYTKLGEDAKKGVSELYGEELARQEEQVKQAAAVANSEEEEKKRIRQGVESARRLLEEAKALVSPLVA